MVRARESSHFFILSPAGTHKEHQQDYREVYSSPHSQEGSLNHSYFNVSTLTIVLGTTEDV